MSLKLFDTTDRTSMEIIAIKKYIQNTRFIETLAYLQELVEKLILCQHRLMFQIYCQDICM